MHKIDLVPFASAVIYDAAAAFVVWVNKYIFRRKQAPLEAFRTVGSLCLLKLVFLSERLADDAVEVSPAVLYRKRLCWAGPGRAGDASWQLGL